MSAPIPPPPRRIESPGPLAHFWRRADLGWTRRMALAVFGAPLWIALTIQLLNVYFDLTAATTYFVTCAIATVVLFGVWLDPVRAFSRMRRDRRALWLGNAETMPVARYEPGGYVKRPALVLGRDEAVRFHAASSRLRELAKQGEVDVVLGPDGHVVVPAALNAKLVSKDAPENVEPSPGEDESVDAEGRALFAPAGSDVPLVDQLEGEVAELHSGRLELEDRTFVWSADGVSVHGVDGEKRTLDNGSIQLSRSTGDHGELLYAELREMREMETGERVALEASVPDDIDTTGIPTLAEPGRRVSFFALARLCRALLVHGWTLARFLPEAARRDADDHAGAASEAGDVDAADLAPLHPSFRVLRLRLAGHSALTIGAVVLPTAAAVGLGTLQLGFGVVALLAGAALSIAAQRAQESPRAGEVIPAQPPEPTVDTPFVVNRLISPGYGVGAGVAASWGTVFLYTSRHSWWPAAAATVVWILALATRRTWQRDDDDGTSWWNALPIVISWLVPLAGAGYSSGVEIMLADETTPVVRWNAYAAFVALFTLLPAIRLLFRRVFWRYLWKHHRKMVYFFPMLPCFGYLLFGMAASAGILPPLLAGLLAHIHPAAALLGGAVFGSLYSMLVAGAAGMLSADSTRFVEVSS